MSFSQQKSTAFSHFVSQFSTFKPTNVYQVSKSIKTENYNKRGLKSKKVKELEKK